MTDITIVDHSEFDSIHQFCKYDHELPHAIAIYEKFFIKRYM